MQRTVAVLCLAVLAGTVWAAEDLEPPLSFYASFDGTLDAVGLGNGRPIKVEGPVEYRPGKTGEALLCGDGAASVFYATAGNLRRAAGTVEMWVCPLDWTGEKDTFHVFLEAKDPGWLLLYRYYQGGILMLTGTDSRSYRAAAGPRFRWRPGEWHHIAGTWRATSLEVYVDGKRAGSIPSPLLPKRLAETFRVGDHPWHVPREQHTLVDEVKLYAAPLDAECIARAARGEAIGYKPRVLVQLAPDPDRATLGVVLDAAGVVGHVGTGRTARVELTRKQSDGVLVGAEVRSFQDDVGRADLPIGGLAEGRYEVRVAVRDAKGTVVARSTTPFVKPGPPVWRGNTLGMEDEVLPPWTALRADPNGPKLTCWGREYAFDTFLAAVRSGGANLLAEPVRLEAVINGQVIALTGPACRVEQASDTRARLTGRAAGQGITAVVRHEVEYDGYTWTDLTIEPKGEPKVEELRLVWTMPADQATLIHADAGRWIANRAGRLSPEGWTSGFVHFFWLGNEERGLSWYAESQQYWRPSKDKPAVEIVRKDDTTRVTVRLIADPVSLTSKLQYGFGMMATPVRPRPSDARGWRMAPGVRPTFEIIWPNGNMKYYGYPEPEKPAEFTERVKAAHAKGCLIVPYVNLNYISAGVPEWQYYGRRWADPARAVTPSDVAAMGHPSMGTCPAIRDWQDFILYRINEMIERYEVDGIYIDCWNPYPCKVGNCGWQDEDGKVHATRPIRAYRRILKRVYTLFRKRRPHPLLMVHMSSQVDIPMLSFTDTILDGEQFRSSNLKDDYVDVLPPDMFRAEFMGRNWGPVAFFLPEFRKPYKEIGTPNLAAYLMLHDVNAWPIWSDAMQWNRLYEAVDAFGLAKAQFHPYWGDPVAQSDENILVSAYTVPGKAMLVIMNLGEATPARVALKSDRLGVSAPIEARDILREEAIRAEGTTLIVPLERRKGRIVRVVGVGTE